MANRSSLAREKTRSTFLELEYEKVPTFVQHLDHNVSLLELEHESRNIIALEHMAETMSNVMANAAEHVAQHEEAVVTKTKKNTLSEPRGERESCTTVTLRS